MIVFINGRFVPSDQAVVSIFDRGFLYGDGIFETILVHDGKPFRWTQHLKRLHHGARILRLTLPMSDEALRNAADELIVRNNAPHSLLRLMLSRGAGPRGYSPKGADTPTLAMSVHPAPAIAPEPPHAWNVITSSIPLPGPGPLHSIKTCNKLPQILARAEADAAGADEALLLAHDGTAAEGAMSNLFWIQNSTVCTPPIADGVLPGVTREMVLQLCESRSISIREARVRTNELRASEGVFFSLSSIGIAEARTLDGQPLRSSPLTALLHRGCYETLVAETGG